MVNRVIVFSLDKKFGRWEVRIKKIAAETLRFLKKRKLEVEIYIIDSRRMRAINKKFRCRNADTNILAFPEVARPVFIEPASQLGLKRIGEIYLNPSYILKKRGDVAEVLVHGLLHLFGYDHRAKGDTIKMDKLEKKAQDFLLGRVKRYPS